MARILIDPTGHRFEPPVLREPTRRYGTTTRGDKARATRFLHDVEGVCDWYFTGTNRQQREQVNAKMRWLKHRAKQAGRQR